MSKIGWHDKMLLAFASSDLPVHNSRFAFQYEYSPTRREVFSLNTIHHIWFRVTFQRFMLISCLQHFRKKPMHHRYYKSHTMSKCREKCSPSHHHTLQTNTSQLHHFPAKTCMSHLSQKVIWHLILTKTVKRDQSLNDSVFWAYACLLAEGKCYPFIDCFDSIDLWAKNKKRIKRRPLVEWRNVTWEFTFQYLGPSCREIVTCQTLWLPANN